MSAIVAEGIGQRFGPATALHPLSLEVEPHEHVAVLGENGAGKTTLLRILATAARPTSGRLELLGLDTSKHRSALRGRIGYLAHQPGLHPALSALENLQFHCHLQGVRPAAALDALKLAGLEHVGSRPVAALSRGMQQRVAIARAVIHQPELLILDEPDTSLDSSGAELLAAAMRGRTVILSTHDEALARKLCTRHLVLRAGHLLGHDHRLRVVR